MNLSEIKHYLQTNNIYLSKQRSQNFLIDSNIITSLINKVNIQKNDSILEIGTGFGALTESLIGKCDNIISYEKDKKVWQVAFDRFQNNKTVQIIHEDFLKADFLKFFDAKFRVIANVPYNITSQILINLWYHKNNIKDIYLLVQKEVGQRFANKKLGKDNSFLSMILQLDFKIKIIKTVSPQAFFPAPKVESVYLEFIPKTNNLYEKDKKEFFSFVKLAFLQKRKKLQSKLKKSYPNINSVFIKMNLIEGIRAENLTPEQWVTMFYLLKE